MWTTTRDWLMHRERSRYRPSWWDLTRQVVSLGADGVIKVWDLKTQTTVQTLEPKNQPAGIEQKPTAIWWFFLEQFAMNSSSHQTKNSESPGTVLRSMKTIRVLRRTTQYAARYAKLPASPIKFHLQREWCAGMMSSMNDYYQLLSGLLHGSRSWHPLDERHTLVEW